MANPMEIDYELTQDDLYAFQQRALNKSPIAKRAKKKMYIYLFLAVVLIAIVPAIGADGFDFSRLSFLFIFGFFALVAGLTWFLERRLTRRAILDLVKQEKPDKGQLGKHTVKLDSSGVTETTAVGDSRTSWAGIDRVEHDADYIFLYTAASSALVIPRRAFTSPEDAERFLQFAVASKA